MCHTPAPPLSPQASPAASPLKGFTIPDSNKVPQTQADLAVYVRPSLCYSLYIPRPQTCMHQAFITGAIHHVVVAFHVARCGSCTHLLHCAVITTVVEASIDRCILSCSGQESADTNGELPLSAGVLQCSGPLHRTASLATRASHECAQCDVLLMIPVECLAAIQVSVHV